MKAINFNNVVQAEVISMGNVYNLSMILRFGKPEHNYVELEEDIKDIKSKLKSTYKSLLGGKSSDKDKLKAMVDTFRLVNSSMGYLNVVMIYDIVQFYDASKIPPLAMTMLVDALGEITALDITGGVSQSTNNVKGHNWKSDLTSHCNPISIIHLKPYYSHYSDYEGDGMSLPLVEQQHPDEFEKRTLDVTDSELTKLNNLHALTDEHMETIVSELSADVVLMELFESNHRSHIQDGISETLECDVTSLNEQLTYLTLLNLNGEVNISDRTLDNLTLDVRELLLKDLSLFYHIRKKISSMPVPNVLEDTFDNDMQHAMGILREFPWDPKEHAPDEMMEGFKYFNITLSKPIHSIQTEGLDWTKCVEGLYFSNGKPHLRMEARKVNGQLYTYSVSAFEQFKYKMHTAEMINKLTSETTFGVHFNGKDGEPRLHVWEKATGLSEEYVNVQLKEFNDASA